MARWEASAAGFGESKECFELGAKWVACFPIYEVLNSVEDFFMCAYVSASVKNEL